METTSSLKSLISATCAMFKTLAISKCEVLERIDSHGGGNQQLLMKSAIEFSARPVIGLLHCRLIFLPGLCDTRGTGDFSIRSYSAAVVGILLACRGGVVVGYP